jgi:hypothetical protein
MLPRLMCLSLALSLCCTAAGEDKDRYPVKLPEPELRIKLVIVPAVFPPHHKERDRDRHEAVAYNLLPFGEEFSVSKEMRSMLVDETRQEQVQLTTVVLK